MPEGNKDTNVRYYSLDKDEFKLKRKENSEIILVDYIEGNFIGINWVPGEYEGRPANRFVVTLKDEDYELKFQFSEKANYGTALLNSLLNATPYQLVRISVYGKNYKEATYPAVALTDPTKPHGDNLIRFKLDFKTEVPRPKPVMVDGVHYTEDGKKKYDHREVIAFWKEQIVNKQAEFKSSVETISEKTYGKPEEPNWIADEKTGEVFDDVDDGLPF